MNSKTNISHIGHAHNDWIRSLDFYGQELDILKHRLTEIAGKNTGPEAAVGIEQYENRFAIQQDNMDRMRHAIRSNATAISKQAEAQPAGYVDTALNEPYEQLRQEYDEQEKAVNELRQDFTRFSAKWM